jgi:quinol monooxygenase YgiN
MPVCQLAHYQVKASAIEKVKQAIDEFVAYILANEPGTQVYLAWQQQDNPTRFVHVFIFADQAAHTIHGQSEQVRRFEAVYTPELVSQGVNFVDYDWIAGKR